MKKIDLNRRDFTKYSVAALGGMIAGSSLVGCGGNGEEGNGEEGGNDADDSAGKDSGDDGDGKEYDVSLLLEEPHVCRGLNTCNGKGKGGENACAGAGTCATAEAHACTGMNACKGQGGCGDYPGQNACKEQGKCEVPLMEEAWKTARAAFEKAFEEKNGKAPMEAPSS